MAMYRALEVAARRAGKEVVLIEAGWFSNEYTRSAFQAAQQQCCPSVRVITLDGREADNRKIAWAGADVFCSLSDNIQETFGITPVEAMASGSPVIAFAKGGVLDTVKCFNANSNKGATGLLFSEQTEKSDKYDYEILWGQRRHLAFKRLGMKKIPALVLDEVLTKAQGKKYAIQEKPEGIAQAFITAGSHKVVASTRTVEDTLSQLIMTHMYETHSETGDLAYSLQQAQIKASQTHPNSDWATFRIITKN